MGKNVMGMSTPLVCLYYSPISLKEMTVRELEVVRVSEEKGKQLGACYRVYEAEIAVESTSLHYWKSMGTSNAMMVVFTDHDTNVDLEAIYLGLE